MNLSVLIHTFNGYQHLWHGCLKGWDERILFPFCIPHIFGTDEQGHADYKWGKFKPIYSGSGEWSDRLFRLLSQINTDYVLYTQEDHYPIYRLPDMFDLMRYIERYSLLRLQISPVNQFYTLTGSELPLRFHSSSKYLVSHQPSIWRKDFLLSCLKPGESPWINEYEGSKRLNNNPNIIGKIAIYPCDWFKHMCVKGKVVET